MRVCVCECERACVYCLCIINIRKYLNFNSGRNIFYGILKENERVEKRRAKNGDKKHINYWYALGNKASNVTHFSALQQYEKYTEILVS